KGAVHYPMVAGVLAGMELLGHLLGYRQITVKVLEDNSDNAFHYYWRNFFQYLKEEYQTPGISQWIYKTLRHPLAHVFLTGIDISITKYRPELHFRHYPINNNADDPFNIDCVEFYYDLERSYRGRVAPI